MKKHQILVVEDNPIVGKLIQEVLKSQYDIQLATDAEKAFELIESNVPDLIILDIMLPGMSGLEFCSLLRNHEKFRHLPVVGLSAKTGSAFRSIAYGVGFNVYLEKPFEIEELKSILKSTINHQILRIEADICFHGIRLDISHRQLVINGNACQLTPKEFDIIHTLARNTEKIVTRERMMERLTTMDSSVSDRSLDNFILSLRRKLAHSEVQIVTHYALGYELTSKKIA